MINKNKTNECVIAVDSECCLNETAAEFFGRKNMKRRKIMVPAMVFLLCECTIFTGCGKKKEADAASTQVLEITITPEATPTPAPDEIDSDAVVTNGNMTMVNEYLAGGGNAK